MRRRRQGRFLFLIVLLAGVSAFSGIWYAAARDVGSGQPAFGGVYIEGMAGAPARINPLFAGQNAVDDTLSSLVFAGLTRLDDRGLAFPDLAETWTISQDGRTYSFVLRQGLIWQDGAAITTDDVLFTYGLLRAPGMRAPPALARLLTDATVTKVDERTLNIALPQPFAPLPSYLTLGILPQHLLVAVTPAALFDAPFNQHPVGAGPYKLDQLTNDHAVLLANPAHHLGQPYVQRLELRFYRDEGALLAALRGQQVQGAFFSSTLSDADLLYLEKRHDLHVTTLATSETAFVYLNLRLPLFQDRRLRQALLYALDRDAIIHDAFDNQALRADSPITPGSWAYSPALRRYPPDTNQARLLLDEAGWRLDAQGTRNRNGEPLAFTISTNADPVRVAIAQALAIRWNAIGARVTVQTEGATSLVRDVLAPRSYQAALFSLVGDADPDPYLAWHSSQAGPNGANLSSLSDDRFDRVLEEARLLAPPPRRKELYTDFQELFAQEVPAIPLYETTALYVQSKSLKGVRNGFASTAGARFWQVEQWFIKSR